MSLFLNNNKDNGNQAFSKNTNPIEAQTPKEIIEHALLTGLGEKIILHACEYDLLDVTKRQIVLRVTNQDQMIHHLTLVPLNTLLNSEPILLCDDDRYANNVLDSLTLAVNKKIVMEVNAKYRQMSTQVGWCSALHGIIGIYDIQSEKANEYSYYLVSSFFPGCKRMPKSEFSVKSNHK